MARGRFLYDRTQLLGPRPAPGAAGESTAASGMGFYLLTPLELEDAANHPNEQNVVIVNRGWIPKTALGEASAAEKQETAKDGRSPPVEVIGLVREGEQRPQFLQDYDPKATGSFLYLDLPAVARGTGIINDEQTSVSSSQPPGGAPVPAATSTSSSLPRLIDALEGAADANDRKLKRRHVEDYLTFHSTPMIHAVYAGTWYTLSAALVFLTYLRFIRKNPGKVTRLHGVRPVKRFGK